MGIFLGEECRARMGVTSREYDEYAICFTHNNLASYLDEVVGSFY